MREIRPSGSEGGARVQPLVPTPIVRARYAVMARSPWKNSVARTARRSQTLGRLVTLCLAGIRICLNSLWCPWENQPGAEAARLRSGTATR